MKKFLQKYIHSVSFRVALFSILVTLALFPAYAYINLSLHHRSMVRHLKSIEETMRENVIKQQVSLTENLANTFRNAIIGMDFTFLKTAVDGVMENNPQIVYGLIFHQSGVVMVQKIRDNRLNVEPETLLRNYQNDSSTIRRVLHSESGTITEVYSPVVVEGKVWGCLILGFSMADLESKVARVHLTVNREKREASKWAFLTTLLFVFIGIIASIIAGRKVSRPIEELTRGAKAIGQGRLDHRISVETKDEIAVLADSFNQMAKDIQRLLADAAEKKRMEIELATARTIQRFILPRESPEIAGLQFSGLLKTSSEIGGDFFDYFSLDKNGRAALIVGDVSGHGVAAGLVVAAIKSALLLKAPAVRSSAELMRALNTIVFQVAKQELLTTCFLGIYNAKTRELMYTNAGHNFPYLFQGDKGHLVELDNSDFPLGLSLTTDFSQNRAVINAPDFLVLFTDGLIESTNYEGEPYNYDRLEKSILNNADATATDLRNIIFQKAMDFYQGKSIDDDITVLVVKPVQDDEYHVK